LTGRALYGYNCAMPPPSVVITPLPPVSAVLFDLDGTLVQTHIDFSRMAAAMRALAASVGAPPADFAGRDILGLVDLAVDCAASAGANPTEVRASAYAVIERLEEEGCADPVPIPGSRELLDKLARLNIRIGIVTRNSKSVAGSLVARFHLAHDVLLTRDDVSCVKPHPQHLWEALRAVDTPAILSAMVGDHPMDIQAGKAAGCVATVGVLGSAQRDRFKDCEPTITLCDLGEAIDLFRAVG
jgi:phosphoglycolate phosphatase